MIDWPDLLARLGGDRDFAKSLLTGFLADLPAHIADIKTALDSGDISAMRRHAHNLRGVAANLAARQLINLAERIEQACLAYDLPSAQAAAEALDANRRALTEYVRQQTD
jgi:HPt (histidine-containing phosphotransfer) domain-containing protein